ncbi:MAG: AGE family epimerase/isomerase [Rhodobacteraceae bacterium]|nr:AGE family epimerase/isomerase [Paracoccaceae bacterium]
MTSEDFGHDTAEHRDWLRRDAARQLAFFRQSLRSDGGFDLLDHRGGRLPYLVQEIHTTTRLVHSYALANALGAAGAGDMIDAGMDFIWRRHRDGRHGGYCWSVGDTQHADGTKLAYGHVFVLLAGASARMAGHPDADRLIADVTEVIDTRFWDEDRGLLRDEFRQDWTVFSQYRGMNANMHGVEAMLAAYEATGQAEYLTRAGRILDFFVGQVAPRHGWRLPEHYTSEWKVDPAYEGNPMFRPRGSTPGHSLELGRLVIQHWDLSGRRDDNALLGARNLIDTALADAWQGDGGLAYTLDSGGQVLRADRYWWPVAEGIGAISTLHKLEPSPGTDAWYRRLWACATTLFVDEEHGGWYPEIDAAGRPVSRQFSGKPDLYHALQADLIPLVSGVSRLYEGLGSLARISARD